MSHPSSSATPEGGASAAKPASPLKSDSASLPAGSSRGRLLAVGWGASVALWAVAYVTMMRPGFALGELLVVLSCAILFAAGWLGARCCRADGSRSGGLASGLAVGAISATVNLLLVGSLFRAEDHVSPAQAARWVAVLYGVSFFFAGLGGVLGGRRPAFAARPNWPGVFAYVALGAAFLLLITGGLVTGHGAGLAVPDWPNSFGHNMLLYPLSEMKGGIYFEHAHRLYGMLVGLTTIVLAALVTTSDRRGWVKAVALLVLAMVVVQGLMGALRVTGTFTTSPLRDDKVPSVAFGIAHGVFAQATFAMLAVLASALSKRWIVAPRGAATPAVGRDRGWSFALLAILFGQLFLGVAYRQSRVNLPADEAPPAWALHGHLTLAFIAIIVTIWVAARATRHRELPRIAGLGRAIYGLLALQVALGIAALVIVLMSGRELGAAGIAVTTAHQAVGALLIAHVAMLAAWYCRALAAPAPA